MKPAPATMAMLNSTALADVIATRIDQIEKYGHDDSALALDVLPRKAQSFGNDALDFLRPGARHDPVCARKRLLKSAALALAAIELIDRKHPPKGKPND